MKLGGCEVGGWGGGGGGGGGGHWEMWGGDLGSDTRRPISGIHVPDK